MPEIRKAYKDGSLRLITLSFERFDAYSWTADPTMTVADLVNSPTIGGSVRKAKSVVIAPYPYHLEKRGSRG